ncbi:nephrocystin-1-like isoform X2 [Centruroides sculpturatus]|uniref:nephrocystin-1-like isoform X1 n=1 Tax=Centruroides sculpturatus TaxID=218467 RepID=UPI000C6D095F|nr:nephrocystin-1-like isoform X1 [Centruroides sculpturatus]XP_023214528.1 nephrocystin-1-like isoform X2 [Centruroides sculpturatus]
MNILSCHIRMCLHDGSKILSNVHTVSAKWESKDPQKWSFISSISQTSSYLEDSKIFIRTNTAVATLGILFQLCIIYKEQKNAEKKELSCGWSFMRLLDDSGIPVHNKSKVLHIHEGNPFDKDVNSLSLIEKNVLKTFISKSKQPQLILRLNSPDKDMKHQLDFLPSVLIGPCSLIFLIFLYRHSLADCLLQQTDTIINTKLQHCPVESTFPKLFQQPYILNILRQEMLEQIRAEKKLTKNIDRLKKVFHRVYKETTYFLLNCNILPPFKFDDFSGQQAHRKEIEKLLLIRQTKGPLGLATSQNTSHKPFSIDELAIDIVGKQCLSFV